MSWIKRILQIFKNEHDDENPHTKENPVPRGNRKSDTKEIDAKVYYQYPKGQFRFPVIADEEQDTAKERQRKSRQATESRSVKQEQETETNYVKQEHAKQQNRESTRQSKRTAKAEQFKQAEHEKPVSVKGSGKIPRGPFKPTEIPSPIYAFNRPKQKEIEHELSGFAYRGTMEADFPEKASVTAPDSEVVQSLDIAPMEPQSAVEQVELGEVISDTLYGEGETAREKVEETERQGASAYPDWTKRLDPAQEEETSISDSLQEKENVSEKPGIDGSESPAPSDSRMEDPGIPTEDQAPPKPKRNIPFNVVMLKQDKQSWANSQKPVSPSVKKEEHKADEKIKPKLSVVPSPPEEKSPEASGTGQNTAGGQPAAASQGLTERKIPVTASMDAVMEEEPVYDRRYLFPALDLLNPPVEENSDPEWLSRQKQILNMTLKNFNVRASVVNVTQGPSVTRFEVQPEPGVKVNKITNLSDDIKLSLAAKDIRIEAPIPGKHTIGIEVPNQSSRPVLLSEILMKEAFSSEKSPLAAALGLDISGSPIVTDLKKMPHGLIAGATGSGKSVCINTFLVSLLYKAHPDDVKLLLIDPKMVELAPYNHIPHLVSPVITDVKAATASLKWAVEEMERRYELFAHTGVRDISRFNELALEHKRYAEKLPYIVIIIDELADLMMMSPADVEEAICRIAQKARACGIHLIIATQRPSVDVITGLIKANVPTRIAFSVSSQVDSRTIIDIGGAEKLLGRGDMLFLENGSSKPVRLQGTFVTDREIDSIVAHVRAQKEPEYLFEQAELLKKAQTSDEEDELFFEACEFVVDQGSASTSSVQRHFKIGYNRAARIINQMEQHGFISEGRGSKPRDVLITYTDLEEYQETSKMN